MCLEVAVTTFVLARTIHHPSLATEDLAEWNFLRDGIICILTQGSFRYNADESVLAESLSLQLCEALLLKLEILDPRMREHLFTGHRYSHPSDERIKFASGVVALRSPWTTSLLSELKRRSFVDSATAPGSSTSFIRFEKLSSRLVEKVSLHAISVSFNVNHFG
jgi:hypothetical protein